MKKFLASILLALSLTASSAQIVQFSGAPVFSPPPPTETVWDYYPIGAGGFVTGIDVTANGVMVNRTDTYGGYVWNSSTSRWDQLVTMQSMPSAQAGLENDVGINEIRIAPSNTARFYMNYNGRMFRSDNSGATWTYLSNYATVTWGANDSGSKTMGPFMAVDPANADIVYVSTPSSGLRVTTNAGSTWSTVSGVGNAGSTRGHLIAFDTSSAVIGNVTQRIIATRYGTGVYESTDGGANWSLLNTTGMPTTHCQLIIDQNGKVYMSDATASASVPCNGNLKTYTGGSWATITTGQLSRSHSIVVQSNNANNVWVLMDSGNVITSTNGGSSWTQPNFNDTRVAKDIPWLAFTNETYMSAGAAVWNPSNSRLYFAMGIGVFYSATPGATTQWTSQSLGIEQMVSNDVASPLGGNPVFSFWDRPVFVGTGTSAFPSTHGAANPTANSIVSGWSIDLAANDPTFVACVCTWEGVATTAGYSSNGGSTWTQFGAVPSGVAATYFNGTIAVSTATNFVWIPFINAPRIYYTTNAGSTWTASTVSGVPTTGFTGWSNTFNNYVDRQNVCADRVTANKFYAYNIGLESDATFAGLYVSTDSGANYTRVKAGLIGAYNIDSFNGTLKCTPDNAGHLFWTGGQVGGSVAGSFYRSMDGGVNWSALKGVTEVYAFGWGKPCPTCSYPALYIAGWVGGTAAGDWGIWRSDDADQSVPTWTRISDGYPVGNFSQIKTIEGDSNTYGTVYVGTIGASFLRGQLQ